MCHPLGMLVALWVLAIGMVAACCWLSKYLLSEKK